jgi:nucleotide-binding universal stress UspA family protein
MSSSRPSRALLVGTDGSEAAQAALKVAIELARARDDKLVLVAIWHELRADFGIPLYELIPDLVEIPKAWAAETLVSAAAEASAAGVAAETVSRYGSAGREICGLAREVSPRLIVIGSTGWGAIDGAVFGSVSRRVLDNAPCPVLLVPAAPREGHAASPRAHAAEQT